VPAAPEPSPFLLRHLGALVAAARGRSAADVACGRGRNARALAARGARAVGLDRDAGALRELAGAPGPPVDVVRCDLEAGLAPPLRAASLGAVVVTLFLHRPLCPALAALLAPGGLLLYETFTRPQGKLPYGPEDPAFLLRESELPGLFPTLRVVAFEEGVFGTPRPCHLARLLARREG